MVPKARHPFLPTHTSSSIHGSVLAMTMGLRPWGSSLQGPDSPKSRAGHPAPAHSHTAWRPGHTLRSFTILESKSTFAAAAPPFWPT